MKGTVSRGLSLAWVMAVMILTVDYIWNSRNWHSGSAFISLAVFFQFFIFKDTLRDAGFRPDNFKQCFKERSEQLIGVVGLLLMGYVVASVVVDLGSLAERVMEGVKPAPVLPIIVYYLFLVCIQQYLLSSFMVNRFVGFVGDDKSKNIALAAAFSFSFVHLPNWFLMLVALPAGYACAEIFIKYRNLYFLIFAHWLIGITISAVFPEYITGGMAVGPDYFE